MIRLPFILLYLLLFSCQENDSEPTIYTIKGFVSADDERGRSFEIDDHSGFEVTLIVEEESVQNVLSEKNGSFSFEVEDSLTFDLKVEKEGYAEVTYTDLTLENESIHIRVPSIPIYTISNINLDSESVVQQILFEMDVKNFLSSRYNKKYFRFFIHTESNPSKTNYLVTGKLGIPVSSERVTPLNNEDARIQSSISTFPYLNNFHSGQTVYFAFYSTSEYDPYIYDESLDLNIYTGLSTDYLVISTVVP
ncbi:MAG: hypothetical protein R8N23_04720 [Reichenbachiella sp.]|uniref:hypothetical protein n=1 Tax=Reichenbachiella sp. TaxID=2184521 RepID=UPI0029665B98|nr:hypothetical protein [Reichenbachiella sp.]MDW3209146.1 hypothetical protein [Reichenbachiella sp.]